MSAQWMPKQDRSPVVRTLEWLTDLVTRFPVATLVLAGLTALASIALTVGKLQFRTSRAELLNPKSDFNRRWIEYTKHFGDKEDVVIVVEGAGPQQVIPAIEDVLQALSQRADLFEAVLGKIWGWPVSEGRCWRVRTTPPRPGNNNCRPTCWDRWIA